eukprot:g3865.t1
MALSFHVLKRRMSSAIASTTEIRNKLDTARLQHFLTSNVDGEGDGAFSTVGVKEFSHGQSNPTYVITSADSSRYVLRKQPPGELLKGAHAVDREHRVMTALGSVGAPVPKTLLFCDDPSVLGTPFFMYEFVDGRFYKDPFLGGEEFGRTDREEMFESMARALAKIHATNVNNVPSLATYGRPAGYISRQINTWTKQYELSKTRDIPEMDHVIKFLSSNAESVVATHTGGSKGHAFLVHGDYRMDNLLYMPGNNNEVAAVLDWELSTVSDTPLGDIAYNCMMYHLTPRDASITGFKGLDWQSMGIPSEEEYLQTYADAVEEFSDGAVKLFPHRTHSFFLSFSFFRAAAILQGVYKRSLQGNASAPNAHETGEMAVEMAEIAMHFAKEHEQTQ